MKLRKCAPPRATGSRSGFTLIELLVVIGIISVLLALTAGAAIQVFAEQQKRVSQDRVNNVSSMLDQQWKAAVDDARSTPIPLAISQPGGMAADTSGPNAERARIIWTKLNLVREFPRTYAEALVPSGPPNAYVTPGNLPPVDAYVQAINNSNQGAHSAYTGPNTEAAACLYMSLRRARRGQGQYVDPESLGKNAIRDSDNDGIMEIVDGWGVPLNFYRFPTGNPEFVGPPGKKNDPQDPGGVLMNFNWFKGNPQGVYWFEQICHLVHDPSQGSWTGPGTFNGTFVPMSWNLVPVVASAGRNGQIALDPFMNSSNLNADSDNIYGYRRFGARGD
jgi:prepilin-type N-terminal cleavage/methylation domain-containing protein